MPSERVVAEANAFLNDSSLHVKVFLYDVVSAYDAEGNPEYDAEPDIARVAAFVNGLNEALLGAGLVPGRAAPMVTTGAGAAPKKARPEDPPPAGVPVPQHDGQPCIFKPQFTNPRTGTAVSAKFQCRLGDACTGKVGQYPWSVWLDAYLKQINEGAA